jgi:MFS family permease
MARLTRARGLVPLCHRGFRWFTAGQVASNVGDGLYAVALPWYVLASHGGALLLGTVLAAYGISRTALLFVGGHASDRWRPWTVMMSTDVVRAVALAALAVTATLGPPRAAILVPLAVVIGAGEGLFLPGSFAIVPALLPSEELQAGNALASGGTQLALLAGPAVGGVLVALAGAAPAFAIDAATFAVSAATLAMVRVAERGIPAAAGAAGQPSGETPPATAETGPGTGAAAPAASEPAGASGAGHRTLWGMLRSERVLQITVLVSVAANLGLGGMSEVALPALAHGPLDSGAGGYGALLAAFGAGALLGTLVAGQVRQARRPFVLGACVFLVEAAFVTVIPYAGATALAAGVLAVDGLANGFGNIVMVTAFQQWAPPRMLGRLMGLLMLASFGTFPVSVAVAALVVHNFGPAVFFVSAGVLLALAILVGLSQRRWRDFAAPAPVGRERAGTERAGTEPAGTEPAGTEPAGTEPVAAEPAATEPGHAGPIDSGPPATSGPSERARSAAPGGRA